MAIVINKKHIVSIEKESSGQTSKGELKKFVNCVLISAEGMRFDIHQKLINQTQLMSSILEDARDFDCCDTIKIFLLCPGEELKKLVQFLHNGKIECQNEEESLEILKSLKNLFGFSDDDLEWQEFRPKPVKAVRRKSVESNTKTSANEKIDCEKTDAVVSSVKCQDTKESTESTNLKENVETMDCIPVENGDSEKKSETVVETEMQKTASKNFFVPWKPPRTSSKLVLVEDKENQGNRKVLTEL